MESDLSDKHPLKAKAYFEYARLLSAFEEYEKANLMLDTAIAINALYNQHTSVFASRCYHQKGVVNLHLETWDSAGAYLSMAHSHLKQHIFNKNHVYFAQIFNDLGILYQSTDNRWKAIIISKKA